MYPFESTCCCCIWSRFGLPKPPGDTFGWLNCPLQGWLAVCMNPCCCGCCERSINGGGAGGGDIIPGLNELREFKEEFCWFLGEIDEGASGEVAILVASEVDILENIVSASGKFGGVAGVFAGVINCKDTNSILKKYKCKSSETYWKSCTVFRNSSLLEVDAQRCL